MLKSRDGAVIETLGFRSALLLQPSTNVPARSVPVLAPAESVQTVPICSSNFHQAISEDT